MTPTVQRIHSANGSHIEPPLESDWSDLEKLRWRAAVVEHDNRLPEGTIKVTEHPHNFCIQTPGSSMSVIGLHDTWSVLTGIDIGLRLATRERP